MAPGPTSWTAQAARVQEGGHQRKHPATQPTSVAAAEPFTGVSCFQCRCRRVAVRECDFVLGEDNPHARPLQEALKVAKMQATIPPIQDRIKACKAYLERARKRVARADAVIARALEQKSIFDGEVADGEKRLEEFQLEEAQGPVLAPLPKVAELQQQIDDLVRD